MACEAGEISPVSAVVLLLQVAFQPAVGIGLPSHQYTTQAFLSKLSEPNDLGSTYGMHEVDLTPLKLSRRAVSGIGDSRLDALDVPNMLDAVDGTITAITSKNA